MENAVQGLKDICNQNKDLKFLDEFLSGYTELTEREDKQLRYYCKTELKGILDLVKTLDGADTSEIDSAISGLWFEFHSKWIRFNAINNYNAVMNDNINPLYVLQSASITYFISKIEDFIEDEQLQKMKKIMTDVQYSS
ncbi:MAG: hypothetical protein GW938_05550 [Leptospira sp.]|jgi:hypothetical protein|nr:hypothetical protein [Leptospira sp.]NCS93678.1 hypothetical protein [Leptospira sp.]